MPKPTDAEASNLRTVCSDFVWCVTRSVEQRAGGSSSCTQSLRYCCQMLSGFGSRETCKGVVVALRCSQGSQALQAKHVRVEFFQEVSEFKRPVFDPRLGGAAQLLRLRRRAPDVFLDF